MDAWDAYFWPNSDVLKNKPGLTDADALRHFEYGVSRQRAQELRATSIAGRFDGAHFRAVHRHLFQDVYAWAGEYRTVEFSKGASTFAPLKTPAHTLASWGDKILTDLARDNHLKGLKKNDFVDRLTHHYGELNYWHPMREGNGRAAKEFLYQLSKEAGYELEFHRVGARSWNSAAERQASGHDPRLAREIFDKIATPRRAIAFRDEHILDAVRQFPELQGAADTLTRAQLTSSAHYDPGSARLVMEELHAKLFERLSAGEIIKSRPRDPPTPSGPEPSKVR